MRYGHDGIGIGGWIAMASMMAVFWVAVAWAIVSLIRHGGHRTDPPPTDERGPARILDERYARGEIDDEEYQRRRAVLRGDR